MFYDLTFFDKTPFHLLKYVLEGTPPWLWVRLCILCIYHMTHIPHTKPTDTAYVYPPHPPPPPPHTHRHTDRQTDRPITRQIPQYTGWAKSRYTLYRFLHYHCIPTFGPPCISRSYTRPKHRTYTHPRPPPPHPPPHTHTTRTAILVTVKYKVLNKLCFMFAVFGKLSDDDVLAFSLDMTDFESHSKAVQKVVERFNQVRFV